jgi:hypothetical protein
MKLITLIFGITLLILNILDTLTHQLAKIDNLILLGVGALLIFESTKE